MADISAGRLLQEGQTSFELRPPAGEKLGSHKNLPWAKGIGSGDPRTTSRHASRASYEVRSRDGVYEAVWSEARRMGEDHCAILRGITTAR